MRLHFGTVGRTVTLGIIVVAVIFAADSKHPAVIARAELQIDDLRMNAQPALHSTGSVAIVDAVGNQRAVLFGVSEGGPISLLFAATHPARVEAIVLYETFVRYGGVPGHTPVWSPDIHKQFTDYMLKTYGSGASLSGFGASRANDAHVQELWGRVERSSISPGGFRAVYEALLETDVQAVLPSVQAPCLVMCAANGSMFEHQSKYLAEHLPHARLVALDGIDHFPWFARSDRIVAEVEEFVTGTRSTVANNRVLATLLFTDIVGSTQRAAELGDGRWHEVLQNYYGLARRQIARFREIEVGTEGDGSSRASMVQRVPAVNSRAQLAFGAGRRVLLQALIAVQKCGGRIQRRPARRGSQEESKRAFRRRLRYQVIAGSQRLRRWPSTTERLRE
jgi:hypothetical protein